jgi:hypothetical protein
MNKIETIHVKSLEEYMAPECYVSVGCDCYHYGTVGFGCENWNPVPGPPRFPHRCAQLWSSQSD